MTTSLVRSLPLPIVLAPLAGGPATPELTAAAANAGAFAFVAAGYLDADAVADRLSATRALTRAHLGVNLFVPGAPADRSAVEAYAALLRVDTDELGEPRFDDDWFDDKIDLLVDDPVAAVSFTFGCPSPLVIERLHAVGSEVWVTVTAAEEATAAAAAGADALVAQGIEAGGHRGTWRDDDAAADGLGVVELVRLVRRTTQLPIVATGGIATGAAIARVLEAGADAAALGTAFLRCPEAGTSAVHRAALATDAPTALTRAFTGRLARGIRNRFMDRYGDAAPSAYPEVHHLTAPLRQAGRARGDGDVVNLWAGEAHQQAEDRPAGEVVARLAAELESVRQA